MPDDHARERTAILATYSNRRDAEMAKSHLDEQGIDSFVVADDVHPPMQIAEGVRLMVRRGEVESAREVLEHADAMPAGMKDEEVSPEGQRTAIWRSVGTGLMAIGAVLVLVAVVGWASAGWQTSVALAVATGLIFGLTGGIVRLKAASDAAGLSPPA